LVERVSVTAELRRSRAQGALVVFLGIFGLVALVALLVSQTMVHQVELIAREHTTYEAHARDRLAQTDAWLAAHSIRLNLSSYLTHPPANVKTWGELIADRILKTLEHTD